MPTRVGKARGTPATNQALPTVVSPVATRRVTAIPRRAGKGRGTPATSQALPTAVSPVATRRVTAITVSAIGRHRRGPAATTRTTAGRAVAAAATPTTA